MVVRVNWVNGTKAQLEHQVEFFKSLYNDNPSKENEEFYDWALEQLWHKERQELYNRMGLRYSPKKK